MDVTQHHYKLSATLAVIIAKEKAMDFTKAKQATIEAITTNCKQIAENHYNMATVALGLSSTAPKQNFTQAPKM